MKARHTLSPPEVDALRAEIDVRLAGQGLPTQPGVAAKILSLVADPEAGLRQYADVLKSDVALSGRLLRLANSAYFAQVTPVTAGERACVLLGLERLKAVSLGFYLSRAAATDPNQVLSRRVWGQSVLRACLAAELARMEAPGHVAEAFTIGLMLDAGAPLLHRLLGKPVERILSSGEAPAKQFVVEFEALPFTHVDVASALMRRWRLPELLSWPIERHHTAPGDVTRPEPLHVLHRIAFYTGSVSLTGAPAARVSKHFQGIAEGVLRLAPDAMGEVIQRATDEYGAIREVFREVADEIEDLGATAELAHSQLVALMDETMVAARPAPAGPAEFTVAGQRVEIEPDRAGRAVAYLRDQRGERLVSHSFEVGRIDAAPLLDALGLDGASADETRDLERHLRSLAA